MPIHNWTKVDAGTFHDFHLEWISTTRRALNNGVLPNGYYAMAEQVASGLQPDVIALTGNPSMPDPIDSEGGVSLITSPPRVRFAAAAEEALYARRQNRIAIRHRMGDRVVAMIEVVSPGNKASVRGLDSFVNKALEFLQAGVHLLILDLFPPGPRDPNGIHGVFWPEVGGGNFTLPAELPLTLAAYCAAEPPLAFVEPLAVGSELPDMPLFLTTDRYVSVPLERTYTDAFAGIPQISRDRLMR